MKSEHIIYEITEDGVGVVKLNRPESLNAMSMNMVDEYVRILEEARRDDSVKALVVTGQGRAFCAGGDLGSMNSTKREPGQVTGPVSSSSVEIRYEGRFGIQKIPRAVADFHKPLIASVNGAAVGGGMDLASMCDYRIASDKAKFGFAHTKVGRFATSGGCFFLSRIVGIPMALDIAWTGRLFDAEEALRIGYVQKVVPLPDLERETMQYARQLATGPLVVLWYTKQMVYRAFRLSLDECLEDAEMATAIVQTSQDALEGPNAHVEKRPPKFTGR